MDARFRGNDGKKSPSVAAGITRRGQIVPEKYPMPIPGTLEIVPSDFPLGLDLLRRDNAWRGNMTD
jgi:hypothetical protein